MALRTLFALSFAALLLIGGESATFMITNNCQSTIWPAALTGEGSRPSTTGFELPPRATQPIDIPAPVKTSGRIWARTYCTDSCITGDCFSGKGECSGKSGVPPATLVEFTLNGDGQKDTYDVSNVDGFNLRVSVEPLNSPCEAISCLGHINEECPPDLAVKGPNGQQIVGCRSDCEVYKKPEYCCKYQFDDPNKCKPSSSSIYFKGKCPRAYSYGYDDRTSTATCPTGPNYKITFCPAA